MIDQLAREQEYIDAAGLILNETHFESDETTEQGENPDAE